MKLSSKAMLSRLGAGASIAEVCSAAGLTRDAFDRWWQAECESRAPVAQGAVQLPVDGKVEILRDTWGIPHILAERDSDLHFGLGWAMAEDRLFQLDYLRRRGAGRLAEILGPEAIELDLTALTVGLPHIAEREWQATRGDVRDMLHRFADGVNARIAAYGERLPIEFDLLGYRPDRWSAVDSLSIACEFRWYLTGRFPVIVIPEMAKRRLGDGPLYRAFLQAEADDEAILPAGAYAPRPPGGGGEPAAGDAHAAEGSNNWVVDGARAKGGKPMVASDPHIAFGAVSCWYEAHLRSPAVDVAGMAYVGIPAIMFGRNRHVAWGCTNNICSQRDLYAERAHPDRPDQFEYDGAWEVAALHNVSIRVRGGETLCKTVRHTRRGPIVDEILPGPARDWGPVSLRWLGAEPCGWLAALIDMNRARSAAEFREATRPWIVPTFCLVYGDVAGSIGYQCTGRIPLRAYGTRGFRRGWDPADDWQGRIPFDAMPHWDRPSRGWIGTANNRVAADDFPLPLSGTWSSGWRARRIRESLEGASRLGRADFVALHQDAMSLRARDCVPAMVSLLKDVADSRVRQAVEALQAWDFVVATESTAAAVFNVFFSCWSREVADARFAPAEAALAVGALGGLAAALLKADEQGWFSQATREAVALRAMQAALDELATRLGPDPAGWQWGRLHVLPLKHVLSGRGDLGTLLDRGGAGVRGDFVTVCNTGLGPAFEAASGAGYRLIADLAEAGDVLWAIDAGSQSGQPGSPHYADQFEEWLAARYHEIPLDERRARELAVTAFTMTFGP